MAEVRPGARNRVFLWPKDSEVLFVTPDAIVYADERGGGIAFDNESITWTGIGDASTTSR